MLGKKVTWLINYKKISALFLISVLASSVLVFNTNPIMADPPPLPPPGTILPNVFCFKITDIRADKSDPEGDKFIFEFEVLNWSNRDAVGVEIMLAEPDTSGVRITDAGVDSDGRPLVPEDVNDDLTIDADDNEDINGNGILDAGEDINSDGRLTNDPMPGNLGIANQFSATLQTETAVTWEVPLPDFFPNDLSSFELPFVQYAAAGGFGFIEGSIPPRNLIGAAGGIGGTDAANALIPGFTAGTTTIDDNGNVLPLEAIDDGNNAVDGFTFTVDDLDPGDTFQLNWFLTGFDEGGTFPLGTSFGGNDYGFGVIIISRVDTGAFPAPVYIGNSGVQQTGLQFFDGVFIVPDPAGVAVEFGAGLTATFLNRADNIFLAPPNAVIRIPGDLQGRAQIAGSCGAEADPAVTDLVTLFNFVPSGDFEILITNPGNAPAEFRAARTLCLNDMDTERPCTLKFAADLDVPFADKTEVPVDPASTQLAEVVPAFTPITRQFDWRLELETEQDILDDAGKDQRVTVTVSAICDRDAQGNPNQVCPGGTISDNGVCK